MQLIKHSVIIATISLDHLRLGKAQLYACVTKFSKIRINRLVRNSSFSLLSILFLQYESNFVLESAIDKAMLFAICASDELRRK